MSMTRQKVLRVSLLFVAIPVVLLVGITLLKDRSYNLISMLVALLSCVPFFAAFEKRQNNTRRMVIIAVMVALSAAGRTIFAMLPGFKPVTALIVITAIYFGPEVGFLTGSLTAVVSNFFFGQGPWTPFQMFTWGMVGFVAGLCAGPLKRSRLLLVLFGLIAGGAYSLMMDVWTVFSLDGYFSLARYLAVVATALPYMAVYSVSNVVFLLALAKPIGSKLERVKLKYGL